MNIGIAKIGQKVYFNRNDIHVKRSNTNGNQGLYKMITLLVDNNKDINFYMLSDSDLSDTITIDNLHVHNNEDLDIVYVITGLGEYEKDEVLIDKLNTLYTDGVEFKFLSEDPRCLESMNNDKRMKFVPSVVITQTNGLFEYKGQIIELVYKPIEKAICYNYNVQRFFVQNFIRKREIVIAIANTSGDKYNRTEKLNNLIGNSTIPVYGRLSKEEQKLFYNYCGELEYNAMMKKLEQSFSTIIIPIRYGWVTSKYMEAIMHGTVPIFYNDYNISLLSLKELRPIVVSSKLNLYYELTNLFYTPMEQTNDMLNNYLNVEVMPYISGRLLSKKILEV